MKLKNIFFLAALLCVALLSFSSCEKDVPDSPWNFEIAGTWHSYRHLEDQGSATFYADGTGVCVAPYAAKETGAPFAYTYTRTKKEVNGKLVITSTADPADYPDLNPECVAFRPGEYVVSPSSTERFVIATDNEIQWSLRAYIATDADQE